MKTRLVFLSVVFLLLLQAVSCSSSQTSLVIYQPEADSPFKIIFYYPDNWKWESPPDSMTKTFGAIYTFDPSLDSDSALNKMSRLIHISVVVNDRPKSSMLESMDLFLTSVAIRKSTLLEERRLKIDKHDAQWFVVKNAPNRRQGENQPTISELIFILAEDRYYKVLFTIPESEVGGRFHTEFKEMVESIRFLP